MTNVPFGEQFERVDTKRLVQFLRECSHAGARITMLGSREQGARVAASLRLKRKNVIVMGQQATIVLETE